MSDFIPVAMKLGADTGDRPSDPDREPDRVWADSGRVVLAPLLVETVVDDPVFKPLIAKLAITGKVVAGGWIVWEHENAINPDGGIPHIYVSDLTSTDLSPRIEAGATHTLTIEGAAAGSDKLGFKRGTGRPIRITPDKIDPVTGVVNLGELTTAAPPTIVQVVEGPAGPSAYQVAVAEGFTGTRAEWLASLRGDKGDPGDLAPVEHGLSWSGTVALAEYTRSTILHATLTGNVTLTLPTPDTGHGYTITLALTQDATGGRTLTLPSVRAAYGVPIALTPTPGAVDLVHLLWDGIGWIALPAAMSLGGI